MRALLIWGGIKLIANFYFVFHIFGVILVLTGLKLLFHKDAEQNLEEKWVYRICSKLFNISKEYQGNNFFTKSNGKLVATPLFIVLILIETTDLIFALDSIPAVIGITKDPFIIYTSNIFAVLGLRSLFFLLEGLAKVFYLLHYAVAVILVFIGTKMILSEIYHLPIKATLIVLISIITISIVGSYLVPQNKNEN